MNQTILKSIALKAVSMGFRLPEAQTDRLNELFHLKQLISHLGINCVLDVGANQGQFARELRGIGYDGLIISFEPIESEFELLKEHFSFDSKWMGHKIALGSSEEQLKIHIPKLTVMSSLLDSIASAKDLREEVVQVRRLDGMLPSLISGLDSPRVFLKMDTQGYDLEVYKGASGCIDYIKGIQSELSVQPLYKGMPHYLEALGVYEAAGFELYNLSVVNRVNDGGLLELNCFMRCSK